MPWQQISLKRYTTFLTFASFVGRDFLQIRMFVVTAAIIKCLKNKWMVVRSVFDCRPMYFSSTLEKLFFGGNVWKNVNEIIKQISRTVHTFKNSHGRGVEILSGTSELFYWGIRQIIFTKYVTRAVTSKMWLAGNQIESVCFNGCVFVYIYIYIYIYIVQSLWFNCIRQVLNNDCQNSTSASYSRRWRWRQRWWFREVCNNSVLSILDVEFSQVFLWMTRPSYFFYHASLKARYLFLCCYVCFRFRPENARF